MRFALALTHLGNFVLAALFVALWVTLLARWLWRHSPNRPQSWLRTFFINAGVGVLVLIGGLLLLGQDGKMLTYLVLCGAIAFSQWWQLRPSSSKPKPPNKTHS